MWNLLEAMAGTGRHNNLLHDLLQLTVTSARSFGIDRTMHRNMRGVQSFGRQLETVSVVGKFVTGLFSDPRQSCDTARHMSD